MERSPQKVSPKRVRDLFNKAFPDGPLPKVEACIPLAGYLSLHWRRAGDPVEVKPEEYPAHEAAAILKAKIAERLPDWQTQLNLFGLENQLAKTAVRELAQLDALLDSATPFLEVKPPQDQRFELFHMAREAGLEVERPTSRPRKEWHRRARDIAELAERALGSAGHANFPISRNSQFLGFVTLALKEIGRTGKGMLDHDDVLARDAVAKALKRWRSTTKPSRRSVRDKS